MSLNIIVILVGFDFSRTVSGENQNVNSLIDNEKTQQFMESNNLSLSELLNELKLKESITFTSAISSTLDQKLVQSE